LHGAPVYNSYSPIWDAAGLSASQFEAVEDPEIRAQVIDEHKEAISCGATGAPAFRISDNAMALTGAHPMHLFRRWINKALDRHYSAASGVTPGSYG
jgi:predicted DsbA family dithiol-disulfide isomerase